MACALLEGAEGLVEERGRARDEQPHFFAQPLVEPVAREEPRVEGGHAHHNRRVRQIIEDGVCLKFLMKQNLAACDQEGVERHEQAVDVIDRKRMQQPVLGGDAPGIDQRLGIGQEIAMGDHRPFGAPGGAGGIEDRRQISGVAPHGRGPCVYAFGRLDETATTRGVQRMCRDPLARSQSADAVGAFGIADDQAGFGITEKVVELAVGIGRVQRQIDGAGFQAGEIEKNVLGGFLDLHRDAIAGGDALRLQEAGEARRLLLEFLIGDEPAVSEAQGRAVGGVGEGWRKSGEQIGGHRRDPVWADHVGNDA